MLLIWSLKFRLTTLAFKNFYLKLFRSYSIKRQGTFSQLISSGLDWTLAWINGWIHHFLVYNKQLVNSANWDVSRRIVPTLLELTCRYLICNFHWWRDQLFRKSCSRSVRQITSWQQTGNEFFLKKISSELTTRSSRSWCQIKADHVLYLNFRISKIEIEPFRYDVT